MVYNDIGVRRSMIILGFPIGAEENWSEDPFEEGFNAPEEMICEVCHVYSDSEGTRYIGIDYSLGMEISEMTNILTPFSTDIKPRKVLAQ